MTFRRRQTAPEVAYKELENEHSELITWWYCGITKKSSTSTEPKVLVCFRKILPDGQLGDYRHIRIPITSLGQFWLGSIWKDQKRFEEAEYDTERFNVDFSPESWEFRSASTDMTLGQPVLIPEEIYPLTDSNHHYPTWMIRFIAFDSAGNRISLIIPCIEFFSRCYGRSQHIKRILCTYPWHVAKEKLYAPLPHPQESNKWFVNLRHKTVKGDSVFLAHACYDEYANKQAKTIWAQLEAAYNKAFNNNMAFPQIAPWFTGPAELKVNGIWIEPSKSFLALQVLGCSDPGGETIYRGRQYSGQAGFDIDGSGIAGGLTGIPTRKIVHSPEIVDITGLSDPATDTGSVIIKDRNFEVLGTPRRVQRVEFDHEQQTYRRIPVPDEDTRLFSGGESHGQGTGIGYVMFQADQIMESHGMLRDIWNALLSVHDEYPEILGKPESLSCNGFICDSEPSLLSFQSFDKSSDDLTEVNRNWPFLSVSNRMLRGALVVRILVNGHTYVYFFEIQRRKSTTKSTSGEEVIKEEPFRGLVFKLKNDSSLNDWITELMDKARRTEGLLVSISKACEGVAKTYLHRKANAEEIPCEAAVRNALKNIGHELPARQSRQAGKIGTPKQPGTGAPFYRT